MSALGPSITARLILEGRTCIDDLPASVQENLRDLARCYLALAEKAADAVAREPATPAVLTPLVADELTDSVGEWDIDA